MEEESLLRVNIKLFSMDTLPLSKFAITADIPSLRALELCFSTGRVILGFTLALAVTTLYGTILLHLHPETPPSGPHRLHTLV